ncbi:MAG: class I SAM-dependent methyltransferase [Burkholderiaceae bacterium]
MQYSACPICKSDQHDLLFDRLDHTHYVTNDRFRVVRCCHCSMVFINPRPDPGEIKTFYPPDFYDVATTAEKLLEEKRSTLTAKANLLSALKPGQLLDIGCQKGEFLYWMKQRGWSVQGIEFSETPPNVFNMPIHYGRVESAGLKPRFFQAITLWAVLEHIHEPVETLRQIADLLAADGRAFVLVPNFRSLPARVMRHDDIPRHLLMFTPSTLRHAARLAGLRVRRIVFSDDIFSGSNRGLLNFLVKRASGESYDEILTQNRSAERWNDFTGSLNGKPSRLVRWVDRIDIELTPLMDRIMRGLRCSFIMTAELERV